MWSNSSRCRQESVYLTRTWCLCYIIISLDIVITLRFSINCPTVIFSPAYYLPSREKPLVKPMAPGSIFHHISFQSTSFHYISFRSTILRSFTFRSINQKTQKYFIFCLVLFIYSIISHLCKWPWRDWQPLYRVGCKCLIVCAGIGDLHILLLLDWYLGS